MTRTLCAFLMAVAVLGMLSAPPAVVAEPYWIAWEGDTFPEEGEWNRSYGNWDGPGEGQAFRTLHDGVMTIDSLHDQGVYDGYWLERPGAIDPGPGEMFVMEWSLRVDEVDPSHPTHPYDPTIAVRSNDSWGIGLEFGIDSVYSCFEHTTLQLDMATTRHFRITSGDMRSYDLYVDSEIFYEGVFVEVISDAYVAWGDGVQGVASLHDWDYFRFGVIPEPGCLIMLVIILACGRERGS